MKLSSIQWLRRTVSATWIIINAASRTLSLIKNGSLKDPWALDLKMKKSMHALLLTDSAVITWLENVNSKAANCIPGVTRTFR